LQLSRIPSVRDDSFEAARLVVRYLAGLGHRRIGFVNWRQEDLNPWRLQGFRQGLRDAGLRCRRAWELAVEVTPAGAAQAVREFLALAPRPTALYCFNNTLAGLVMEGLRQDGRRVPEEVSVVGGGGEEVPGLTCHQADWGEMGRTAVRLVLQALAAPNQQPPEHHLCPHTLRVGLTTGAPV
jgi:DNA-binding LacI/PurR family transcriptional regulator